MTFRLGLTAGVELFWERGRWRFCSSLGMCPRFGVRLADGREVVVKRRADESGRTRHCVTGQRLLAEQGFPCPMPLTDVIFGSGFAVHAERLVGGGEVETEDTPAASGEVGRASR